MKNVVDRMTMYDDRMLVYHIEVRKVMEHYETYVDGDFWASADNRMEVEEDIKDLASRYNLKK